MSESYPFLAVAKSHHKPYRDVLLFADYQNQFDSVVLADYCLGHPNQSGWQITTIRALLKERERRARVSSQEALYPAATV